MYVRTDRSLIPAGAPSRRGVVVNISAPAVADPDRRPAVRLSLVLDRSGSMGGGKIEVAKEAAGSALRRLSPADRFALVVFDNRVDVLVESTPATRKAVDGAAALLSEVGPRCGTDLVAGWLRGCEQAAADLEANDLGRCLLLTDGRANHGLTDHDAIVDHARELARRGVATSTIGVGADFDEVLLQGMAMAGLGRSYYAGEPAEIPAILAAELGETLEVAARAVRLTVSGKVAGRTELLSLFPTRRDGDQLACDLGDLASGQEVTLVFAVMFRPGEVGEQLGLDFEMTDRDGVLGSRTARLSWTRVPYEEAAREPRDQEVARILDEAEAQTATRLGLACHERGEFECAAGMIEEVADRLRARDPDNAETLRLATVLSERARMLRHRQPSATTKSMSYDSSHHLRSRRADGTSRRRS